MGVVSEGWLVGCVGCEKLLWPRVFLHARSCGVLSEWARHEWHRRYTHIAIPNSTHTTWTVGVGAISRTRTERVNVARPLSECKRNYCGGWTKKCTKHILFASHASRHRVVHFRLNKSHNEGNSSKVCTVSLSLSGCRSKTLSPHFAIKYDDDALSAVLSDLDKSLRWLSRNFGV